MNDLKEKIKLLASGLLPEINEARMHLHAHPELSGEEKETATFLAMWLKDAGIQFRSGIGGHGIVAMMEFNGPGPVVALRADMDALPILEQNEVPYRSVHDGIMHACGHDVHMACLLGAVKILGKLNKELAGSVKIIFQPSEEKYPGGAITMIREGVLENPRPDLIIAQHVYPELEAGKVGMRGGFYMASTDEVYITVNGKGGHAAIPQKVTDPVLIASHIVVALQQIVSRNATPTMPTVLSFGRMIADGRTNIIPDEVRLEGIIRTFDDGWRSEIKDKIVKLATSIARGMGASCDVFIDPGYPALYNDPELTGRLMGAASEYLGPAHVEELPMRMTAEDFSYYAKELPACFYRLGVMNEKKGIVSNLHTSTFDVDVSSLQTGMGMLAWLAASSLGRP